MNTQQSQMLNGYYLMTYDGRTLPVEVMEVKASHGETIQFVVGDDVRCPLKFLIENGAVFVTMIPSQLIAPMTEEKSPGLYRKYVIFKADGTPLEEKSQYLVIRVDNDDAGRMAALAYASMLEKTRPELSESIRVWIENMIYEDIKREGGIEKLVETLKEEQKRYGN